MLMDQFFTADSKAHQPLSFVGHSWWERSRAGKVDELDVLLREVWMLSRG